MFGTEEIEKYFLQASRIRCSVPESSDTSNHHLFREALWAKYYTGAPARQRRSVERYSGVKRVKVFGQTAWYQPDDGSEVAQADHRYRSSDGTEVNPFHRLIG